MLHIVRVDCSAAAIAAPVDPFPIGPTERHFDLRAWEDAERHRRRLARKAQLKRKRNRAARAAQRLNALKPMRRALREAGV